MKKQFFRLLVILSLLLCLSVAVGCGADIPVADTTSAATDTVIPTESATEAPTEAPTEEATEMPTEEMTEIPTEETTEAVTEVVTEPPILWEVDTGVFNEGKVTYTKAEDGSITATPAEGISLGLDVTHKTDLVSICYSVWFDYILRTTDTGVDYYHDISQILAGNKDWGGSPSFHYWAKPALGYYCSSNREVIRTHMSQLYAAGVDFIILDHTNLGYGLKSNPTEWNRMVDAPMIALFETIMEMRTEGLGTPYVVVWVGGGGDVQLYQYLYDNYYGQEKWADCFVYWDGKPFLLTTYYHDATNPAPEEFTVRCMGGLWDRTSCVRQNKWNFLSINNAKYCTESPDGAHEQIGVCVASQETYMSADTAHGRMGGLFWYAQWTSAFEFRPKFVTLTWWNEWTAQRLYIEGGHYDGQYHFTDAYSPECSRDIEPMEGGHGDQYYRWMIQYVYAYKNHRDCPVLVEDEYLPYVDAFMQKYEKGTSLRKAELMP